MESKRHSQIRKIEYVEIYVWVNTQSQTWEVKRDAEGRREDITTFRVGTNEVGQEGGRSCNW
jgi:hypothetical protein